MWTKIEPSQEPIWDYKNKKTFQGVFKSMDTEVGPNASNLWHFEEKDGGDIAIWGSTVLDTRFKHLQSGDEVKIVYKGLTKSPKTGRAYHDFDIWKNAPDENIPDKELNEIAEELNL